MSIDRELQTKVPPKLALTALLSSGITVVTSICYTILSIIALVYRFDCNAVPLDTTNNAQFTWQSIYRIYIQSEECRDLGSNDFFENLTQSFTVFVLINLTLCFSVLTLVTGSTLTAGVKSDKMTKYINVIVSAYIVSWVGSLVVDVTLAIHLGMDYAYFTEELLSTPLEYNFVLGAVRHGVFVLMSVVLKGYVILALNIVLITLLVVYTYRYHNALNEKQHSIHKEGALHAFGQPRQDHAHWVKPEPISPYASPFARGQTNHAYMNEDDQPRNLPRTDYYATPSQSFNRSHSWQHQPPNSHSSRPFSYMDEVRQPVPVKPPVSPAASSQDQWRREPWQQPPPVPAPDYSPHTPRRLKSALKPAGYM